MAATGFGSFVGEVTKALTGSIDPTGEVTFAKTTPEVENPGSIFATVKVTSSPLLSQKGLQLIKEVLEGSTTLTCAGAAVIGPLLRAEKLIARVCVCITGLTGIVSDSSTRSAD